MSLSHSLAIFLIVATNAEIIKSMADSILLQMTIQYTNYSNASHCQSLIIRSFVVIMMFMYSKTSDAKIAFGLEILKKKYENVR